MKHKQDDEIICESLDRKSVCFKLFEYNEGEFIERFHQHVPKYRISDASAQGFVRTLLIKHSAFGNEQIIRMFLNKRAGNPAKLEERIPNIESPEPGVLRVYRSMGPYTAWHDTVINRNVFRNG